MATIKDAIALHFARSLETLDTTDALWQQWLADARAAFLAGQQRMEDLYYLKHGIVASGPAVAEQIANDLLDAPTMLYQNGAAFRLRVVDMFEEARRMAASAHLEIIRPLHRGQFLIGDVPAISLDTRCRAFGIRGGVPFRDATTVILPLSPRRLAVLGSADTFAAVPGAAIRWLNGFQVASAKAYVYMCMHPESRWQGFVASQ